MPALAGTYPVGSGKTFSTFAAAQAQLYTDWADPAYNNKASFPATQTIDIYNGTYTEQIILTVTPTPMLPTAANRLVIMAHAGNSPVFSYSGNTISIGSTNYVDVIGIQASNSAGSCAIFNNSASYGRFQNLIITSAASNGIYPNSGSINVEVSGCTVYGFANNATGIKLGGTGATCFNNIVHDPTGTKTGTGISVEASGASVHNNAVYNISATNGNGIIISGSGAGNIYTNEVYNCYTGIYTSGTSGVINIYTNNIHDGTSYSISAGYTNVGTVKVYGNKFANKPTKIAGAGVSFYNNLIINSTAEGINFGNGINGANIINNTFYNCATITISLVATTLSNIVIKNNIVVQSSGTYGISVDATSQSGLACDYNQFYVTGSVKVGLWGATACTALSDWKTASSQDANSQSGNPNFVNAGGTNDVDYKLSATSPCIDKGVSQSSLFTVDYFGTSRPQGAAWDIGFNELVSNSNLVATILVDPDMFD